ncbi:MAG: acyl-CoA dehydrogenase family protein [bacterium JZ-2024 1]
MDFELTKTQKMIADLAKNFAEKEIQPIIHQLEEGTTFPGEQVKRMGQLGLMGLTIPREYGGAGVDTLSYLLAVKEISRVSASLGIILSVHISLACEGIYKFGSEEQKKKFLPDLVRGEKLGAFALTEPQAGSDAGGIITRAHKKEGKYYLSGTKSWVTSGPGAGVFLVFARLENNANPGAYVAFIVTPDMPGFHLGKVERKLGILAAQSCEIHLNDCEVPEENLLGKEGEGLKIALSCLDSGRLGVAAQAIGIAEAAYSASLAYAKERVAFGQRIADFQAIQWMLVEMYTRIEQAKLLLYYAATKKDRKESFTKEAAMAKVAASETAMWTATKAIQIHGGIGYSKEFPLERYFRDAKVTEIYEGTSEIQRLVIARHLLKSSIRGE